MVSLMVSVVGREKAWEAWEKGRDGATEKLRCRRYAATGGAVQKESSASERGRAARARNRTQKKRAGTTGGLRARRRRRRLRFWRKPRPGV
jgi:hypothetical protein